MRFLRAVAAIALVGCGHNENEPPPLGAIEAPIVNPTGPYVGPSVTPMPPLGAHGRVVESTDPLDLSANGPHGVQFTDGVDLAPPPVTFFGATADDRHAWTDALGGVPNVQYVQSPAFKDRAREASDSAELRMAGLSSAVLKLAAQVFAEIPEFSDPTPSDPVQTFAGWLAPRARWQDQQWAFGLRLVGSPPGPERHFQFPTPSSLALMPERGARLYCAAEQMALAQTKHSLGEKVLIPISILGQDIDIGVFEPFAYVDNPERFTGGTPSPSDGAQAFNIPFQLGVVISPLRPFLPSLPELRYPLVLSAVDGEVVTYSDPGLVWEDTRCIGPYLCIPLLRWDLRKRFKTSSHVDSALSVGQSMATKAKFPLFWAGPLLVQLDIAFGASVGTTVPSLDGEATPRVIPPVGDDRLLSMQTPPVGWPATVRDHGTTSGAYFDGFWRIPQSYFNPDAGTQFYDVHTYDKDSNSNSIVTVATTAANAALRTSILEDDDHHVAPTSELGILGGLEGDLGFSASIASLTVAAKGEFKVTVGLAHDVRDAVSATTAFVSTQPVSNLTITPTTYANAGLHFVVNFHLHISLPIVHDIDVNYDIINKDIPIASDVSPWDESHRVRLGTASTTVLNVGDDVIQKPGFVSHAGKDSFVSFPQTIAQCLADPPVKNTVPETCKPAWTPGTPQHVEACIWMEISPQIDPCLTIPVITDTTDKATKCAGLKLAYMCGPVAKEQFLSGTGTRVLAHRLDLPTGDGSVTLASDELERMSQMVAACADSEVPVDPDAWFKAQFTIATCDASATLIDSATLISERPDPGVTAGSCP